MSLTPIAFLNPIVTEWRERVLDGNQQGQEWILQKIRKIFYQLHKFVTLMADVMFVNGIDF